jgi:hypothetical protein
MRKLLTAGFLAVALASLGVVMNAQDPGGNGEGARTRLALPALPARASLVLTLS